MAELEPLHDYSHSRAVVMGTWDYAQLPNVLPAANSLRRMVGLLTGSSCGWPRDRVEAVENERNLGVLPDRLITAFEGVADVALFYYVGHGQIDLDDQLCLGLVDSRSEPNRRAATSLPFQAVRRALIDSPARTKIVILDCCFAGLANQPANTLAGLSGDVLDKTAGTGAYTLAASGAYTTAWYENDSRVSKPQTYFTKYLVDLVEAGIAGQPPLLRMHPLFTHLRDNLTRDRRPIPCERSVDAAREFVFAYNAAPPETHRDRDSEVEQLYERLAEAEARRAREQGEAEARVQALRAEAVQYVQELERLRMQAHQRQSMAPAQQRELQDAIKAAERKLDEAAAQAAVAVQPDAAAWISRPPTASVAARGDPRPGSPPAAERQWASPGSSAKIRASAGTGRAPALAETEGWAEGTETDYALARVERADLVEGYFVAQEISRNPSIGEIQTAAGRIELAVSYNEHDHLSQAKDDVALQGIAEPQPGGVVAGHLLLQGYETTSLRESLHLPERNGSVPIVVPVPRDGDAAGGEQLRADRRIGIIAYDFEPGPVSVPPASLNVGLFESDSLDSPALDLMAEEGLQHFDRVIAKIKQEPSSGDDLLLHVVVHLNLPIKHEASHLQPKVSRVAIEWPHTTSLRTLSLHIGEHRNGAGMPVEFSEAPVRYNPVHGCLEWDDVPMFPKPLEQSDEHARYESAAMLLSMQQPGTLDRIMVLQVRAEVEIPGYLLSGLAGRLYDATGRLSRNLEPTLTTRVRVTAELMLDDAFAKREFSPCQRLFFDEVVPDEMRIDDIVMALRDRGFKVRRVWPTHAEPSRIDTPGLGGRWLLAARRQEGPDVMDLWILVEGQRFQVEREVKTIGGLTRKRVIESGELSLFMRGTLSGGSRTLTHEMNTLHRTLRERYNRMRRRG